nr:translation initiation factor IF-2 [Aegilops tauschii subsp. strangulata]
MLLPCSSLNPLLSAHLLQEQLRPGQEHARRHGRRRNSAASPNPRLHLSPASRSPPLPDLQDAKSNAMGASFARPRLCLDFTVLLLCPEPLPRPAPDQQVASAPDASSSRMPGRATGALQEHQPAPPSSEMGSPRPDPTPWRPAPPPDLLLPRQVRPSPILPRLRPRRTSSAAACSIRPHARLTC